MRIQPALTLAICSSFVAACGDDPPLTFDQFIDQAPDAVCANAVECEGFPDLATCLEAVTFDEGELASAEAAIADGTVIFDAAQAAACLQELRTSGCVFEGFHIAPSACDKFIRGTIADGGACIISDECADDGACVPTDAACDPDVMCCPGSCESSPPAPIGGVCDAEIVCEINSYCKRAQGSQTGTCTAVATAPGAACDGIDACANPMICDLDLQTFTGVCVTPAASGATCDPDTLFIPCADTRDYCDVTTQKCEATKDVGAACSPDIECIGFATCVNAICAADPGLGDACTEADDRCLGSLECIGTSCALPTDTSPTCQ